MIILVTLHTETIFISKEINKLLCVLAWFQVHVYISESNNCKAVKKLAAKRIQCVCRQIIIQ